MISSPKFGLGTRLAVGFAALLSLMIAMTFVGIIYVGKIYDHLTEIVGDRSVHIEILSLMERSVQDQAIAVSNLALTDDSVSGQQEVKRVQEQQEHYREAAEKLEKSVGSDAGKALLSRVKEGTQSTLPLTNRVIELAAANNRKEATRVLANQYRPAQGKWSAALSNMVRFEREQAYKSGDDARRDYSLSRLFLFGLGGVGLILGALIAFFLTRAISRPISHIVEGLAEGSEQVASASEQVASASQSLAEGASQQAAALQETSSAMEEMASMTKQNADNAQSTNQAALAGSDLMRKARESMKALVKSIEEVANASENASKIIKTIDEIAFQTNLLALNAAVEAARAGEAGAGFAVVADEVRSLAMRAAEAAKNTSQLIEGTIRKVKEGSELVHRTEESYRDVDRSLRQVVGLVGEIAAASQEQAQGIEQINKAVAEMDKVVQQNAASSEESASASEEMHAQAEQMKEFVGHLVALVGGEKANGVTSVRRSLIKGDEGSVAAASRQLNNSARKTVAPATRRGLSYESEPDVRRKARAMRPEEVIPFEDGDFKEF